MKQFAITSPKFFENDKKIAITGYSETGSNPSGGSQECPHKGTKALKPKV